VRQTARLVGHEVAVKVAAFPQSLKAKGSGLCQLCRVCVWPPRSFQDDLAKRFMELPEGDSPAALQYIRDFGDFGSTEISEKGILKVEVPDEIATFCRACKASRRNLQEPFVVNLHDSWAVRKKLHELWDLNTALVDANTEAVRLHCKRLRPTAVFRERTNWFAMGKALLCTDLSASLNSGRSNPRIILHELNGKLVLQTMCMNVRTGLHLTLLEKVLGGTGYRLCARPDCGKYFIAARRKQYHSQACQNAAKVQRYRDRHNPKKQVSGAGKVSHFTGKR